MLRSPRPCVVIDASAIVERLLGGQRGAAVAQATGTARMAAPHHVDSETMSALAGLERAGKLQPSRAEEAVADLVDMPLSRMSLQPLLARVWSLRLRHNFSRYDAGYVALTMTLDAVLVTADRRMARAASGTVAVALV